VVEVWRRTETGEAPRWHGATPGLPTRVFQRGGVEATENIGNIRARSNAVSRGVPDAAPALGWVQDASPVECSQTFTTGC